MKALLVVDPQTNEPLERDPIGTTGQASWSRLEDILRRAGEVRPNEQIAAFVVTDAGWLQWRLR